MTWTKLKRVARSGFYGFWRNGFVSLASILIMMVTLFVIGSTLFAGAMLNSALQNIKNQVDINVYFVKGVDPSLITSLQQKLQSLPEVLPPVTYVSEDQALADFRSRHQNDQLTLQALDELGTNPFGASLNIKAKDPSQYGAIAEFLQSNSNLASDGSSIIDKINYYENQAAIDRLSGIILSANKLGFILTALLIIISILITFNTLRLVIYMSRDEIAVMRLVGASQSYIRGPFFIAGALYGFFAAIITLILFYPITIWLAGTTAQFLSGFNIFQYYFSNFGQIFLIIVFSGVAIGALSSWLATRAYVKI